MASERQTGIPRKGGDEYDALGGARRFYCCFKRPGVAKQSKRSYNRRVRRTPIEIDPALSSQGEGE